MNRYMKPAIAVFVAVVCGGCQSSSKTTAHAATETSSSRSPEVGTVKSGVLARYNSTTVGKAFEGTFQNPKWSSFESPKGATIVEFNGTVRADALEKAGLDDHYSSTSERESEALRTSCIWSLGLTKQVAEAQADSVAEREYDAKILDLENRRKASYNNPSTAELEVVWAAQAKAIETAGHEYDAKIADLEKRQQRANDRAEAVALTNELEALWAARK